VAPQPLPSLLKAIEDREGTSNKLQPELRKAEAKPAPKALPDLSSWVEQQVRELTALLKTDAARMKSEFRRLNLQLSFNPTEAEPRPYYTVQGQCDLSALVLFHFCAFKHRARFWAGRGSVRQCKQPRPRFCALRDPPVGRRPIAAVSITICTEKPPYSSALRSPDSRSRFEANLMRPRPSARVLSPRRLWLSILLLTGSTARAERLPINTYTTAEGLLRDTAYCIVQDSRSFLWFCTGDGLSRFDGYGFTNYTTDEGLPHRTVNGFLETRSGAYWVATTDGLAHFNPMGRRDPSAGNRMFITYRPENNEGGRGVNVLFEDHQGRLWCGTDDGLYWFEERNGKGVFHRVDLPKVDAKSSTAIMTLNEDKRGTLWIGSVTQGLFSLSPDSRIERFPNQKACPKPPSPPHSWTWIAICGLVHPRRAYAN
jgi:Two component regulator propeller